MRFGIFSVTFVLDITTPLVLEPFSRFFPFGFWFLTIESPFLFFTQVLFLNQGIFLRFWMFLGRFLLQCRPQVAMGVRPHSKRRCFWRLRNSGRLVTWI